MRINEVDRELTQTELDQLETFADKLFAKVGIDVEFTRHFLDRVNDERNVKQITASELTRLFKQEYKRWGKQIAQLGPDTEAVLKDLATDVNIPFALRWDSSNNELDLIAKTVMRKTDFKTSNQEFAVETYKLNDTQSKLVFESIQQLNEAGPAALAVPAGIVAWQAYSAYRYSKAAWWVAQGAYATAATAAAYIVSNEADFSWLERKMAASALLAYELWDKVRGVEDLSNEIVSDTNDKLNSELAAGTEELTKQAVETKSISAETAKIIAQTNAAAEKMNQQFKDGVDPTTIAKDYVASLVTNKAAEETVKQIAVVSPEVVSAIQTELENNYQDASGQRASELAAHNKAIELANLEAKEKADAQNKASDAKLIALANDVAKAQADAQTKASDDKLIALANKVAATQAQQANDKYQNDKIDDIATKSDAQTRASDANLIAKSQAYAQAKADAQAQAKADAQAQAKADADAQAKADAAANNYARDLEKNPLPVADFTPKDIPVEIPTTGNTTVKEPIKVTVPQDVIVQPEIPAVDYPSTTQGTAVKTPDITIPHDREKILVPPFVANPPKVNTTTFTPSKANTNNKKGQKRKGGDGSIMGYNDLYKTNLYKWTQKYGAFENLEMGRKLFGEDYAKMTHALITKMVKQGKTNDEIQKATGEHGKRIELIRKSTEKKKVNESVLMEGGAMPGVGAIHIDEINPTLEQLEKTLDLDLKNFTLGSVGKRQFSGDIDVALNLKPEELPAFIEKLKKNPLIKDIAKSSVIMTKVQIQNFDKSKSDGRPRTGFVQLDFMPGDPGWLKTYFHSPSEKESKYKGVFRNVMVATMAAVHNRDDSDAQVEDGRPLESRRFMWSPTDGLVRVLRTPVPAKNGNGYTKKNQNKIIDGPFKQADEIAKQLGLNSAKDLNSFESLLDAMKKNYTQEEQKKVIDGLKDSKVVQDIGIPDEIKDL